MTDARTAPPCTIVIFGAAGDLTKRLLMPSIVNLANQAQLNADTRILGADHNDRDTAGWRNDLGGALRDFAAAADAEAAGIYNEKTWSEFSQRLEYLKFDFTNPDDYQALDKKLRGGDGTNGSGARSGNALFYLAVSPHFFEPIAIQLASAGLMKESPTAFRRLIIEKPFGRDLASATKLNDALLERFAEPQIYRIDHFLGKEAVYGITALRFGSRMLEPLLTREHIESVQITAAETVGVEARGAFYEETGALRDMVPNHLFSLLTMIAMEQPKDFTAEAIRDAKVALLNSVRPLTVDRVANGQYTAGTVLGKPVRAYRDEPDVARDSTTETYVALDVRIDNDRWRDVPFYIRTGKSTSAHVTTISLLLRSAASSLDATATEPHLIVFGIDPERGLEQRFAAKLPGADLTLGSVHSGFRYDRMFGEPPNIGYETLLFDAMRGETKLFQRNDMIQREWTILEPVLDKRPNPPQSYAAGSAGPSNADALLARDGHRWLDIAPMSTVK